LIESSISGHLAEPIEVDQADSRGLTPLNCASIKGDLEMVKNLVSRGNANTNQSSPKGCTPLMYAGRGGYSECVRFLLEKKASALKQDNAGGTVLHHAIEKGHTAVLETLLEHGVDVYSVIEVADNAGRTPIFEAVENMLEDFETTSAVEIINILTRKKALNGFGAKVNILNYQGQTPLFSAAREGNIEAVRALIAVGARVDLNNGELVKPEEDC
jgi:ankyrin repeat protein